MKMNSVRDEVERERERKDLDVVTDMEEEEVVLEMETIGDWREE